MIFDNLKSASLYEGISPRLKMAFDYLRNTDFENMGPGKHEIDGTDVYALVQQYETSSKDKGVWEAHRKYIDVQFVVNGVERMGCRCKDGMKIIKEYEDSGDYLLLEGEGSFFKVSSGFFAVFFPEDAHMPGIEYEAPVKMKKVVVKVKVD